VCVTYGRGSVHFWRRSDTLCTSGFMDDVIFAHKFARRRRPAEAECTRSLGLGYKPCAVIPVSGQRTHGTTIRAFKVTSHVATPGAESAVSDCLVFFGLEDEPDARFVRLQDCKHVFQVCDTIRYDTRCCFIVRSKTDIGQLNLPHKTNN